MSTDGQRARPGLGTDKKLEPATGFEPASAPGRCGSKGSGHFCARPCLAAVSRRRSTIELRGYSHSAVRSSGSASCGGEDGMCMFVPYVGMAVTCATVPSAFLSLITVRSLLFLAVRFRPHRPFLCGRYDSTVSDLGRAASACIKLTPALVSVLGLRLTTAGGGYS